MNKEKIIIDFIVFILLDFEELLSDEIYFFDQTRTEDSILKQIDFSEVEYEKYLQTRINLSDIIVDKEIEFTRLNKIDEILNSKEIYNIVVFLNNNYKHGFPDDFEDGLAFGGNFNLEISNSELIEYFYTYLSYDPLNKNVYITYYFQFMKNIIYFAEKQFEIDKKRIDKINVSKELLEIREKIEFVENKKNHFKDVLFKSVENLHFQLKGFADDYGVFIDFNQSLSEILKFSKTKGHNNINDTIRKFDNKNHLANLTNQYFELIVLNANNTELKYDSVKQKELASDLLKLKEENIDLIEYLITKKFSDSEIDIILNTLSDGHYNDLNIRNINFTQQINYFHFCYAFYIFDFFNEKRNTKFTTENSFKEILKYSNSYLGYDKNAFLKYYKNIKSDKSHSDYPFKRFDKILNEIEEKLRINTNKLKKIIV